MVACSATARQRCRCLRIVALDTRANLCWQGARWKVQTVLAVGPVRGPAADGVSRGHAGRASSLDKPWTPRLPRETLLQMRVNTVPGTAAAMATLAVLAMWGTSCSTPPRPPGTPSTGTAPSPPVSSAGITPLPVCFGPMPVAWVRALRARRVTTPGGVRFGPGGIIGGAAIGEFDSAADSGIGKLDFTSGRLTTIFRFPPGTGGMGAMAVEAPWVIWEELDSQTNLNDWSIHLWNLASDAGRVLATSRLRTGHYVSGQQPLPVVRNGFVAWAQPVPSSGRYNTAQIRVADPATGRVVTLDTGRVSSPAYAGPYLVWARIDSAGRYVLRIVDAASFKPVVTPGLLRNPGSILYLAGSPDNLAWGSGDLNTLTVWPVGTARVLKFTQSDSGHPFEFLQLAGHFVLWYTGNGSSVLDLRTGGAFDVAGSVAASAGAIAIEQPVGHPAKGAFVSSRVSILTQAAMPGIRSCAKNT